MKKIGFIGIGVMGNAMAQNLIKAGYEVSVYTRTKEKANEIIEQGAVWCDTIKECASHKDVVITIVGYPKDVEEVYLADEGILNNVNQGTYVIDMTTTSPKVSKKIYEIAKEKGIFALDAPVSGGDIGAKNGTLTIMVGGDKDVYTQNLSIFSAMGSNVIYEGFAGSGQHVKMANQIAIAGALSGVCEAAYYSGAMNVDLDTMIRTISGGAASSWQLNNLAPKMVANDYTPGFFLKHLIKDLGIAIEEAKEKNIALPILDKVHSMCKTLEDSGFGEQGTQCLIEYYKQKYENK